MMPVSSDLRAFRRTLAAGVAARWALLCVVIGGAVVSFVPGKSGSIGAAVMLAGAVAYVVLSVRAIKVSREAMDAPERLASGDLESAEELLTGTIRRFSIFPAGRVVQLHQLAALRYRQGRRAEAVELATAVLAMRAPPEVKLETQLLRLEALLELGDLQLAHQGLLALMNEPLRFMERARVTALRIWYEAGVGAYHHLLHDLPAKVAQLEVLPGKLAAQSLVRLSIAADMLGQIPVGEHLRAKAICLHSPKALAEQFATQKASLLATAGRLSLG